MKNTAFILSTLLLAGAPLPAQDKKVDTERLIERLGDPDYQTRKAAEKKLLGLGEKALEALKRSAEKHDDPEVQWRAGRLVRRIQAGDKAEPGGLSKRDGKSKRDVARRERRAGPGSGVRPDPDRIFDDVMKRLGRPFDRGEFRDDVRKEIERAMQQVRKSLRDAKFDSGFDFDFSQGGVRIFDRKFGEDFDRNFSSSSKSMKMSSGPDGVRVEITEKGKEPKVYEVPDMETFKKKYPGVLKDIEFRFDAEDFPFRGRRMLDLFPKMRRFDVDVKTDVKTDRKTDVETDRKADRKLEKKSSGKKLGFYVAEVSPAVREYLELDEDLGLGVESVTDGSLAEKVGLKKGDIVIRVGSRKIFSPADVSAALDAIGDDELRVHVIRRGREMTLK